MSLLIIIIAVAALTLLSWGGLAIYEFITHDGYGRRPAPPSHHADLFDPHSGLPRSS